MNSELVPNASRTAGDSEPAGIAPKPLATESVASLDAHALPSLPRPRMPLSQRAKIFIPFDPLKGYQEALREKERETEALYDELAGPDAELDPC